MISNMVGPNIKKLRKHNNMTQEQLAQKLNMKRQTLSNYEIGKRMPDIYELVVIADIFDITLDELAGRKRRAGSEQAYVLLYEQSGTE